MQKYESNELHVIDDTYSYPDISGRRCLKLGLHCTGDRH